MSAFMSFVGGGLRAVNDGINRHREYLSTQEDRDFKRELLEFKRNTLYGVQNLRTEGAIEAASIKNENENFSKINGGFRHRKHPRSKDNIISQWNVLSNNVEEFKNQYNDAKQRQPLISYIAGLVTRTRAEQDFHSNPNSETDDKGAPPKVSAFMPQIANNPILLGVVQKIEANKIDAARTPTNTEIRTNQGLNGFDSGSLTVPPKDISTLKKAANVFTNVRFRSVTSKQAIASLMDSFGKYDNTAGLWEGSNKFWNAADGDFVNAIKKQGSGTNDQIEAANKWLFNPNHGFVNKDGSINIRDVNVLVSAFGYQKESSEQGLHDARPRTIQKLKKDKTTRDRIEAIQESYMLSKGALKNINSLIDVTRLTDTGSDFISSVMVLKGGIPAVINDGMGLIQSVLNGRYKREREERNLDYFKHDEKLITRFQNLNEMNAKALAIVNPDERRREIEAAKIVTLQTILAYQITSILQGGTGGRTISDNDVERAMAIFSGSVISKEQKLAKLQILKDFITRANVIGSLYSDRNLRLSDNAGKYYTTGLVAEILFSDIRKNKDDIVGSLVDHVNSKVANISPLAHKDRTFASIKEVYSHVNAHHNKQVKDKVVNPIHNNQMDIRSFIEKKFKRAYDLENKFVPDKIKILHEEDGGKNYFIINDTQTDNWIKDSRKIIDLIKKSKSMRGPRSRPPPLTEIIRKNIPEKYLTGDFRGRYAFNLNTGKEEIVEYTINLETLTPEINFIPVISQRFGGRIPEQTQNLEKSNFVPLSESPWNIIKEKIKIERGI